MDNNNKKKLQLQFNINNINNNNNSNNSNINKPTTSKNYNNNNDDQDNKINDNCNINNDIYKVNNDDNDDNEIGGGNGDDDDEDDKKYKQVNKKNEILNKKLVKSNLINESDSNNVTTEDVCEEKLPLIDKEKDKLHVQFESSSNLNTLIVPPIASNGSSNHPTIANAGVKGSSSTSTATPDSLISSTNSEDDEDDNSSIEIRPPDGGWGWVVVFASFMINLIADGITFSFGIIYIEFLSYFGEGKAKTAWIGSLFMAMPLLSGPFASFLTDRYGCRKVTIAGSLLAALGFIISSFSNSMEMLFITFGIMSGFGLSLCYVAAVVIVAYYFDKRRSFATGLSVCGSGIGTFIFAPLTNYLIKEYGWRGTTLILAGAFLHMTVCGMLMRDLEWTTHSAKKRRAKLANLNNNNLNKKNNNNNIDDTFILNDSINNINSQNYTNNNNNINNNSNIKNIINNIDDSRLFSSLITLPTFIKYDSDNKVPTEIMDLLSSQQTNNINQFLLKNYPNLLNSRSFSEPLSRCTLSPNDNFNNVISPITALHEEGGEDENGDDDDGGGGIEQNNDNEEQQDDNNEIKENKQVRITSNKKVLVAANHNEQVFTSWMKRNGGTHCTTNHRDHRIPHSSFLKDLRMHRHSLTYRGAMLNINRYRLRASSCPDIYRNSMTTIAKEKTQWYHGMDEFKNSLIDILDFSYFADMRFFLFALSNFLLYTWYDVPYVYLADNAVEKGLSIQEASMLISIIGIVNMFGEILLGWVGDCKNINATYVYAICMALCGIVTGLIPLLSNYYPLSFVSGAFGFFIAANYSLTSIILVELITIERFTNAYGLLLLVQGIANLIGPPLGGHIYDVTGSYDLSFYLSGLFIAFSGFLFIILPIVNKYKKYINNNIKNDIKNLTNDKLNIDPEVSNITQQQKPLENNKNNKILIKNCFNNDNSVKVNHV